MTINRKLQTTTPPEPPSYADRMPLHSWVAGAGLPLVQSIITSIAVMIGTAGVIYVFDGMDYAKPMIIMGGLTFIVYWLLMQNRWLSLTRFEIFLGQDLNDDGVIGEPPEPFVVKLQDVTPDKSFRQDNYNWTQIISREKLIEFSYGVIYLHKPISRRTWTPSENGFSDPAYREWQKIMIASELIEDKGDHFEPTERGWKFFTHWANQSKHAPTPPHEEDDMVGDENPG